MKHDHLSTWQAGYGRPLIAGPMAMRAKGVPVLACPIPMLDGIG